MKKRTTLYLEEELIETAKKLGLNLSRICEIALEDAIKRLMGANLKNEVEKCGGWDLNPRRPTPEDLKSSPIS